MRTCFIIFIVALIVRIILEKIDPDPNPTYKPIVAPRRRQYTGSDILKICPRCGLIYGDSRNSEFHCYFCKSSKTIQTPFTYAHYINDFDYKTRPEWEQELRQIYVLNAQNEDLDMIWYNLREDKEYQDFQKLYEGAPEPYVPSYACPVCGGTSFTPVRRKWTFMAGYRTNKIDMVCNQCGHVKEG